MSQATSDESESALMATVLANMGSGGDLEARLSAVRTLLSRAEESGDAEMSVRMMHGEALALSDGGRMDEAEARYREARVRAEALPDRSVLAKARRELGLFLGTLGRVDEAEVELAAVCAAHLEASRAEGGTKNERLAARLLWGQSVGDLGISYQRWGREDSAALCLSAAMRIIPVVLPNWVDFAAHHAALAMGLTEHDDACSRLAAGLRDQLSLFQASVERTFPPGELPETSVEDGPGAVLYVRVSSGAGQNLKHRALELDFFELVLGKGLAPIASAIGEASGASIDEIAVEATLSGGFRITPRLRGEAPAALRPLLRFTVSTLLGMLDRRAATTHESEVMVKLSALLADQGEFAAAEPLCCMLYADSLADLGPDDPITTSHLMQLGFVLWNQDKLDEADEAFRRALPVLERTQGADSDNVLVCAFNLGAVRQSACDFLGALSAYRDVIERHRRANGREATPLPMVVGEAQVLADLGRDAEAIEVATRALALARAQGDTGSEMSMLHLLANAARERGDLEEARARAEEAVERARGGDVGHVQPSYLLRARVRSRMGDHAGAEEDCQRAIDLLPRCPDRKSTTHRVLASVLRAAGRVAEARAAIDTALAARGARISPEEGHVLSQELAEVEAAEGRSEDAARRLSEVLAFYRRACGADSAPARRVEARLGSLFRQNP